MAAGDGRSEGKLCRALWDDQAVRERMRHKGMLTDWPTEQTVGVASSKSCIMNRAVLEHTSNWWCPQTDGPDCIPINLLRKEAGSFKTSDLWVFLAE